ncbi:MAG TPA: peptidoglycan DD-metalloendopeptidase family protein [Usitatibacter sp.]
MKKIIALALLLVLTACATNRPAPVVERTLPTPPVVVAPPPPPEPPPAPPVPTHTVKKGDTLVSIALQYGLDYRDLVTWNNIANPNRIEIGQVLMLGVAAPAGTTAMPAPGGPPVTTPLLQASTPIEARPTSNSAASKVEPRATKAPFSDRVLAQMNATEPGGSPVAATPPDPPLPMPSTTTPVTPPVVTPPLSTPPTPATEPEKSAGTDKEDVDWIWPVKGKVLAPFTETTKGMDIAGKKGAPVLAAAGGRVVYAGLGLRGYGKLVIIKHNNTWLSAYAHNDNILVKEQQDVKKGQKIAEMGSTDSDQVMLHFEVRRQGKPVDPAKYLPAM